jgi:hypothetical protein
MYATINNRLQSIKDCYIKIQGFQKQITMNILPDISDSKSVAYSDEDAIGRSTPFKSYKSSENRSISWTAHFIICYQNDAAELLQTLRIIEAAVYPMQQATGGAPYAPPPICKLKCGSLLGQDEICAVMKNYSVKFDTSVPWDEDTLVPYKLDIDMQFDVVYNQSNLPGAEKILKDGY